MGAEPTTKHLFVYIGIKLEKIKKNKK